MHIVAYLQGKAFHFEKGDAVQEKLYRTPGEVPELGFVRTRYRKWGDRMYTIFWPVRGGTTKEGWGPYREKRLKRWHPK